MHIDNKIVPFSELQIPDWYEPAYLKLNKNLYSYPCKFKIS